MSIINPCDSAITCELKNISPLDAFKRLIVQDENGCPAINTVEVTGTSEDFFITCDNKEIGWKDLFFRMITLDSNNKFALKIVKSSI